SRSDERNNDESIPASDFGEHELSESPIGPADRHDAYAALADIARALERIEPHSPVPYLIKRAVAWGGLNTAQLYNEVFVRCGGHINIFELLGLEDQAVQVEREPG
ncbi:MAG TPA: hypothetical protein VFW00_05610, partial [Rhodocyclaceae bacterium]|nr:hypothetical protein [Rhodocyclaceae bacterium]